MSIVPNTSVILGEIEFPIAKQYILYKQVCINVIIPKI